MTCRVRREIFRAAARQCRVPLPATRARVGMAVFKAAWASSVFFWATAVRTWRTTFLTRVLRLWLRNRRFSFCRARFRAEICLA